MKKITFTVKANPLARNEMHFEVQKRNRVQLVKPKKGKGLFKRNKKVSIDD